MNALVALLTILAASSGVEIPVEEIGLGIIGKGPLEKIETGAEDLDSELTTPAGIYNFVGIGYNMIEGNPEGSDDLGGIDPGVKANRHILALTYHEQVLSPDGFLLPDQVLYTVRNSLQTSQATFHGTKSYVSKVQGDIEESHGVEGLFDKVKFSTSRRYSEVQANINAQHYVYYEEREVNLQAQARYRIELAESEEWPLDEGFVAAACKELHSDFDDVAYWRFIDTWGTHFITEVSLGTKSATRYEESRQGFVHYAHSTVSKSVSFEANLIPGFKAAVKVDMGTFNAGLQVGMSFGEEKNTYYAGGMEYPEPIGMSVSGMHEIFAPEYWMRFADYVDDGLCESHWINHLEVIAANMEEALTTYAVWKNAQESEDPVVAIPISWPKGTYGLPMPIVDCPDMNEPESNSHLTWAVGWRFYDTENSFSANEWSSPNHFKGPIYVDDLFSYFCMKTVTEADIYDWEFQPGAYCVYKKGPCPTGMFDGFIYWDDEDTSNDNAYGGEMPEGIYNTNTEIRYCCRIDGYASNPIYLPTDRPFYLMTYTHQCQKVYGMKATLEWVKWDNQDTRNNDATGGAHPYEGVLGQQNVRVYYCYYEEE